MLNVWRTRIWKLMSDGGGSAEHGKPGGSEKLVPRDHVEAHLLEESCMARRMMRDASRPNPEKGRRWRLAALAEEYRHDIGAMTRSTGRTFYDARPRARRPQP